MSQSALPHGRYAREYANRIFIMHLELYTAKTIDYSFAIRGEGERRTRSLSSTIIGRGCCGTRLLKGWTTLWSHWLIIATSLWRHGGVLERRLAETGGVPSSVRGRGVHATRFALETHPSFAENDAALLFGTRPHVYRVTRRWCSRGS